MFMRIVTFPRANYFLKRSSKRALACVFKVFKSAGAWRFQRL
jgi:hypothetical protein